MTIMLSIAKDVIHISDKEAASDFYGLSDGDMQYPMHIPTERRAHDLQKDDRTNERLCDFFGFGHSLAGSITGYAKCLGIA